MLNLLKTIEYRLLYSIKNLSKQKKFCFRTESSTLTLENNKINKLNFLLINDGT